MGVIAEGLVAYAQPLIDATDGSIEQLNKAFAVAQLCFNEALLPADKRFQSFDKVQEAMLMDDAEFARFRQTVVEPMIRRHEEMFPGMHGKALPTMRRESYFDEPHDRYPPAPHERVAEPVAQLTTTQRYAPCPCGSGKKYKFCCGQNPR